jgi:hypothetical protein
MCSIPRVPLLPALLLAASPLFSEAKAPLPTEAHATSAECGACHAKALEQWASSEHATGATNDLYRVSHDLEPMQWCENCHRPQAEGVSCAACHVRAGVVLSAQAPTAAGQHAHAMRQEPRLSQSAFCGECHQFNFPIGHSDPVTYSPHRMQRTLDEWTATGAQKTCQQCHGAHAPRGAHDVERLRAALDVTVERVRDELRLRLEPKGVAHHFPTGDPFRRLRVELCADEACAQVLAVRELERRIAPAGDSWRIASDTTVPPEGLTVAMPAPPHVHFVRVAYRYAARSNEPKLPEEMVEATLFTQRLPSP